MARHTWFSRYVAISGIVLVALYIITRQEILDKCFAENTREIKYEHAQRKLLLISKNLTKAEVTLNRMNIITVFGRLGYSIDTNLTSDWDLMWALNPIEPENWKTAVDSLKQHQKVSNIPGIREIAMKQLLHSSPAPYLPKTFRMPDERDSLAEYADEADEDSVFIIKRLKMHAGTGISPANITEILQSDSSEEYLVEELVTPFLIDDHKMELAVYVAVTSVNPLRVYMEAGDYLIRLCSEKYYPFDLNVPQKYVNANKDFQYLETREMPSLARMYNKLNMTNKEAFFAHARKRGFNTDHIEEQIAYNIYDVFKRFESNILNYGNMITGGQMHRRNFFQLVRFDMVLDKNAKVFVLEVNNAPMLSDIVHNARRLHIEQTLYTLLNLVGVTTPVPRFLTRSDELEKEMRVSGRQISIFPEACSQQTDFSDCEAEEMDLCVPCLSSEENEIFYQAYLEHIHKHQWKRVMPRTFKNKEDAKEWEPDADTKYTSLLPASQKMTRWFWGKCLQDEFWCK